MAKVIFSLTTAQLKALRHISASGRRRYGDYGATNGVVAHGWARERTRGDSYAGYVLTAAGKAILAMADALKLPDVA